jgi:anti-sigma regulatory factor (Ser/Thr protein kinase)
MSTPASTAESDGHAGLRHEAFLYGSDAELQDFVTPLVQEGLDAGQPVALALQPEHNELLRRSMPEAGSLVFLDRAESHARPSRAVKAYRELLSGYVAGGAPRVRIIGEFSRAAFGPTWWWWARYESAVNQVYAGFPAWTLCLYDTRTAPADVLDDVSRTHPHVSTPGAARAVNERYVPPAEFAPGRAVQADPLEAGEPLVELVDPSPVEARHVVLDVAGAGWLPAAVNVESVVLVLNEAVTNAAEHGIGPVRVRLWSGSARVVVTVSDRGPGPADPLAGLVPAPHYPRGGVGLWLSHELCDHVTLDRGEGGYTFRGLFGDLGAA